MDKFWQFAAMMLHYKRLLLVAALGVALDALCVVGGYGTLTWLISVYFEKGVEIRQIVRMKLQEPSVQKWAGDVAWIADLVPASPLAGLAAVLGFILLLAAIGSCGRFLHEYCAMTVTMRTVMRIRKAVFARLIHLPMATFTEDSTAERASKVVRDCQMLSRGMSALMSRAVRGIVLGVALLVLAIWLDWRISLTFLVVVPGIFAMIRKFGKTIRRASKRALEQYGVMLGAISESLQGLRVVKVHHAEGYERRRFTRINRRLLKQEMRARTARAISSPLIEMITMMGVMLVILVAAWSVLHLNRSPGELIGVLLSLAASAQAFRSMTGLNNNLQEAAAASQSIHEVLRLPTERTARQEHSDRLRRLPRHRRSVEFCDITFTYPGAKSPSLRNVHLAVPAGTMCAIVGANGSGKSTLLSLLPRLYAPDSGRVLVDGVDIAGCSLRSIRRQLAVVTQETVLFEGSIAENILYGSRHADEARMIAASRRAHAHDFISILPDGYATQVGERGVRLSGGQRQRIAIARAILRDPAILILDEATSQIDSESEAKIADAITQIAQGRTLLVIAHRLSTVVNAHMIVVMVDGSIASIGTHRELMASSDVYRALCRTQIQGLEAEPV